MGATFEYSTPPMVVLGGSGCSVDPGVSSGGVQKDARPPSEGIVAHSGPEKTPNGVPNGVLFGNVSGVPPKSENLSPVEARA